MEAALLSVHGPLPRISSGPLQDHISSLPCQKQGRDHSHCLSGPHSDGCPCLLLLDSASSLGRCQTMSVAPSQPFLAGHGLWNAASSFLGLGTNALSYQEASPQMEHFACQRTAATGMRCVLTSICSSSSNAPACARVQDVPLPPGVYGEPPAADQTSRLKSTSSPFTNQPSHHHPTRAEQIGLTLVLHVWDAPARRCPAKDQGAIHAMTFLVCTLITWHS